MVSDLMIALGITVIFMAGMAYEIAGITLKGWHTVSYSAHRSWLLRVVILGSFLTGAVWWWGHSAMAIGK